MANRFPKRQLDDLAIRGAAPAFASPVHVGRPNVIDQPRLAAYLADMLERAWLTNNGPYVQQLERQIADYVGVRHCVAVANGTIALQLAIRAAGLAGDVIVPSYTFIATAHALQWQGIKPVFGDIDPVTHNLDPARIEHLISARTTGIIGVHLWGRPCDVDSLARMAQTYGLQLLFDAAHAFGCSYRGRMVGGFGRAEVFSFHATKFFHTFEGGAVVTDDTTLADEVRLLRNFGFAGYDRVVRLGINGKMSEMAAAMGLTLLPHLDALVAVNRRNYERYAANLAGTPGVMLLPYDTSEANNYQYVVIEVDERGTGIDAAQLVEVLHAENVLARRYFYPGCHGMEPYRSQVPAQGWQLPVTDHVAARVVCLPTGPTVDLESVDVICDILDTAVRGSGDLMPLNFGETLAPGGAA